MSLTALQAAQELQRRKSARDDLLAFCEYTKPDWAGGPHHRVLADQLMAVERGEVPLLAVHAPRRHSKSEMVSRRFPAFYLGRHPGRQLICASVAGLFAEDIGADVRDILKTPRYSHVFPDVELAKNSQAAGRWRVEKHGGLYYAASVGKQVVGRGAHLAIIDDPHNGRQDADSPRMRDVVHNWYLADLYPTLMHPRAVILVMTRWHEDDLAGRLMPPESEWVPIDEDGLIFKAGEWRVVKFQAIRNEGTDNEIPLWPGDGVNGFPLETLREIRRTMVDGGREREWQSQYQQNPVVEDGAYIRREWFADNGYEIAPANLRVYIAGDFALRDDTTKRDPDWTEFGVFGIDEQNDIYVLDWWSGRVPSNVWIDRLIDLVEHYEPNTVFLEGGMIRRAVESVIQRRMIERNTAAYVEWVPPLVDKAVRGRSFQAWASMGRVHFPTRGTWRTTSPEAVINQCVAFPSARHDDKFDVLSLMCQVINEAHPAIGAIRQKKLEYTRDYKTVNVLGLNKPGMDYWKVV